MTDNRSDVTGSYPIGFRYTCILNEGNPTVSSRVYNRLGNYDEGLTFAAELHEGDFVALANDADCTFTATGGLPVVEKAVNTESLVIGKIVGTPRMVRTPAASGDADTLAKRLAGNYYRVAVVEIFGGITKIEQATLKHNGTNAVVPGVGTTLNMNITASYANNELRFDAAAANGVGVIPLTYAAAGTDGDLSTILVGITGLMYAVTGA